MTDTLFDLSLSVARALGEITEGTATGGSATTIVDATRRVENDDYWNQGAYWITYDAGAASAAPEKEFGTVTDFANSSGTLTIETVTVAVAAGDRYGITGGMYPLDLFRSAINQVLDSIYIGKWDTTSLDTADNQTEYTLPAEVFKGNLLQVWVQTYTGDANDNRPQRIVKWWVKEGATGAQDTLVIPQYASGYDIWLYYKTKHPHLNVSTDELNEGVHPERIKWRACEHIMRNMMGQNDTRNYITGRMNEYKDNADLADQMHPIILKSVQSKFNKISDRDTNYTGEVGKVRL